MLSPKTSALPSTLTDLLLVDTDVATAIYAPLLRETYRVHAAGSWEAALQLLTRIQPALVITELGLGGTWGLDLCRHAKALPVPATVLVTTSDVTRVPDALDAGCDAVLLKPFAPNLLHARIGRLLRGRLTGAGPSSGTNRAWPEMPCPSCNHEGVICFEFSSHRRAWYACLKCREVWIGQRQE